MSGERARGSPGNRILVVDARVPTPDQDAGSSRMYHLLTILKALSWDATFVGDQPSSWPPFDNRLERDTACLEEAGVRVVSGQSEDVVEEQLRRDGRGYDAVMLSGVFVAARHLAGVRRYAPEAAVLFDTVDLHHIREYREARLTGNARRLKRALQLRDQELAVAAAADFTLVVSPVEKETLERACPGIRVRVVSTVHEVDGTTRPFAQREGILFVGSYHHSPNVDAAGYLVRELLPLVRRELPGVKSYLLGSNPPPEIAELASEEIVVPGYQPDLRPYFDRCKLSVAPLRFGAGVKGKLLTSLGYGVPVVASPLAAEGMGLADGRELLIADGPEAFAA
ncbi:MAG: glycosyltransferase, partial [Chloroflexota bacterium]